MLLDGIFAAGKRILYGIGCDAAEPSRKQTVLFFLSVRICAICFLMSLGMTSSN